MVETNVFTQALQRGQEIRNKQDEVLALFVNHIRKIDDLETLEVIKKELSANG